MTKFTQHTILSLALFIIVFVVFAPDAWARTIVVDVTGDNFTPRKVELNRGDRVLFRNYGRTMHSIHLVGHVHRFGEARRCPMLC